MRRIVSLLAGVLLVVPSLGSDSPRGYEAATAGDELHGTWREVEAVSPFEWTFRGGQYVWKGQSPAGPFSRAGTYTIVPRRKIGYLDHPRGDDRLDAPTWNGIYELDRDTLRIATRRCSAEMPESFDQDELTIWTLKRVKR